MNDSIDANRLAGDAAALVRQLLSVKSLAVEHLTRGVMTHKFVVSISTTLHYVVRFYPASRSHVVAFEPDLLKRCAAEGIRVPQVVADSRTGPRAELQYVVYKKIEGTPLADQLHCLNDEAISGIARELVDQLVHLSHIWISGFGGLVTADDASCKSWAEFVQQTFEEGLQSAIAGCLWPLEIIQPLKGLEHRARTHMRLEQGMLTWGDISPENILLTPDNKIAGLIDFEGAIAGDLMLNLGYCFAQSGHSAFFNSLARSWPKAISESDWERIYLYTVIRALRLARFAGEPLPTGHRRMAIERLLPGFQIAIERLGRAASR